MGAATTAAGGGNEAIILNRLRARSFRNTDVLSAEDGKFGAAVHHTNFHNEADSMNGSAKRR